MIALDWVCLLGCLDFAFRLMFGFWLGCGYYLYGLYCGYVLMVFGFVDVCGVVNCVWLGFWRFELWAVWLVFVILLLFVILCFDCLFI